MSQVRRGNDGGTGGGQLSPKRGQLNRKLDRKISTARVLQPDLGSPLKCTVPALYGLFHFLYLGF